MYGMEREATLGETAGTADTCIAGPSSENRNEGADIEQSGSGSNWQESRPSFSEQDNVREYMLAEDRRAATALMQLHGGELTDIQSGDGIRVTDRHQNVNYVPDMTMFYNQNRLNQSRSDTGAQFQPLVQSRTPSYPVNSRSTEVGGSNAQDSVAYLSSAFSNMQQQQALMSQRQEGISDALCNLTSLLQDIRNSSQSQTSNAHNPVSSAMMSTADEGQQVQSNPFPRNVTNNLDVLSWDYTVPGCNRAQPGGVSRFTDSTSQNAHPSHSYDGSHRYEMTSNRPVRMRQYRRPQEVSHTNSSAFPEAKLPPFNGKEDWKVWINRFEAVAERRCWDEGAKLDNLLPRLQGRAGDFVFNQLPHETLSSYPELVKELNSRFRVVETQKTFAAKFSQRTQKHDETVEEYAADLKRLYFKAYKSRDSKTRQEDLVRRFLDGLKDSEARFEIEYNKEPEDIDDAVYHAVNFMQTRRRSSRDTYADRKFKKYARRTSQGSDHEDIEMEQQEDTEDYDHVMRIPMKADMQQKRKPQKIEQKTETPPQTGNQSEHMTEIKDMVKALANQIAELQNGRTVTIDKQQGSRTANSGGVICYACTQRGHISRNCPNKTREQRPRDNGRGLQPSQGKGQGSEKGANSLN